MAKFLEGAKRDWKFIVKFTALSVLFWFLQFQFQLMNGTDFNLSLIRSFAFSGAMFISLALITSSVFKFKPKLAVHWNIRRAFGVIGFIFIALHFFSVTTFLFKGDT